jgi:hypothetical protein
LLRPLQNNKKIIKAKMRKALMPPNKEAIKETINVKTSESLLSLEK